MNKTGYKQKTVWSNKGKTILYGGVIVGSGSVIDVGFQGTLTLGTKVVITGPTTIRCQESISIGESSLLSWDILLMDSDFHPIYYIIDKENENFINKNVPIEIGKHVWIGCRCMILKGTNVSDNNIIAAGTILSGDIDKSNSIIANKLSINYIKQNVCWDKNLIVNCSN